MSNIKYKFFPDKIYCGDNLKIIREFPDKCIDLIYIDPPFFSNKNYEIIWHDGYEKRAFKDRWKGGIQQYINWMKPRVKELHRVLKDTGSFYLHCDYHADSYLRVMCDRIFGYNNLVNKIVWQRTAGQTTSTNSYKNSYDVILFYSKSDNYTFNPQYDEIEDVSRSYNKVDKRGKFQAITLIKTDSSPSVRNSLGESRYFPTENRTVKLDKKHGWLWSQEKINNFVKDGGEFYWTRNGNPRYKKYKKEGRPADSIWLHMFLHGSSNERLGYPTQKPEVLLERIIKGSSNKGDVVLDVFCGCGTAIAVAKKLKRKWIGIDISPTACKLMAKRIRYKTSKIIGMKYNEEQLKELEPFEFQNWVLERIGGRVNPKKVADKGIDGIIPIHSLGGNLPVEVKQHQVGRPDVDKFETVLRREKKKAGFIVGFSFSKNAYEEIARFKNEENLIIKYITVKDLLKENNK
ncbi:MAG: hypothetical protein GF317_00315 [Candidatus Lokiarchaeota archaeon]|nr:hypothetical protein [Candidatus Lokiarchaeota archaeon]